MRALSFSKHSLALALACLLGMGTLAACGSSAFSVEYSEGNVSYPSGDGVTDDSESKSDSDFDFDSDERDVDDGSTNGADGETDETDETGSVGATEGSDFPSADSSASDSTVSTIPSNPSDPSTSTNSTNSNSRGAVNTLSTSRNARDWSIPGASDNADTTDTDGTPSSTVTPSVPIEQVLRPDFYHGPKPAEFQKYIVLHDTEGTGSPYNVIGWWEYDGKYVASHFIVGRDGQILQVVPMDQIAHHAGFGDAGHNDLYGTTDESRDDRRGTIPIGDWAPDYGMNSYSIGIEMVHEGGIGQDYPEAQLEALDALIAYIDAYYGFESQIIDHKAWRSYNSDTNPEFATYLANYQTTRTHDGH